MKLTFSTEEELRQRFEDAFFEKYREVYMVYKRQVEPNHRLDLSAFLSTGLPNKDGLFKRRETGEYEKHIVQTAWWGWKAALGYDR